MRCRGINRWLSGVVFVLTALLFNHVFYFELRRWLVGPFRLAFTTAEALPPPLPPDRCLAAVLASLPHSKDKIALRAPTKPLPVSVLPPVCAAHFQALRTSPLPNDYLDCFRHSNFSPDDLVVIQRDLRVLKAAFATAGLPLFLTAGSLIGSWRHHGFIPYDTDIDFGVRLSDRTAVITLLHDLARKDHNFRFKNVESTIGHLQLDMGCRWAANGTFITSATFADFFYFWNITIGVATQEPPHVMPARAVYPLRKRPFLGMLLDVIADYPTYFAFVYGAGLGRCEKSKGSQACPLTDCDLLRPVLPFVVTYGNSSFVAEVLVREGTVQSVFTRSTG